MKTYHGYGVVDANVKTGVRYCDRLRQNDLDGNYAYSEIRTTVLTGEICGLQVYPYPVRGELSGFLAVDATTQTELILLALNGCVVLAKAVTGPAFTLHLNHIPKGICVLKAKLVGGRGNRKNSR